MTTPTAPEQLPLERPWWKGPLLAFDTETTGPDPRTARIVSAGVAYFEEGASDPAWTKEVLIDPGVEIPAEATAVHGITTERARALGLPAGEGVGRVADLIATAVLQGASLVIFNAPYDATLLQLEGERHGLVVEPYLRPVIDPLLIDRRLDKYRKGSRKLIDVARAHGIELREDEAHGAVADCLAAGRLVRKWTTGAAGLAGTAGALSAMDFHRKQAEWYELWRIEFNAYQAGPKGKGYHQEPGWPIMAPAKAAP